MIPSASEICFERAVARVANGLWLWKSRKDQIWNWFWFVPPPPWQEELEHEAAPRILGAEAASKLPAAYAIWEPGSNASAAMLEIKSLNHCVRQLIDLRATRNLLEDQLSQCNH